MAAAVALFLGVAFGNPYSKLIMEEAWREEITYDWDNLDHVAT